MELPLHRHQLRDDETRSIGKGKGLTTLGLFLAALVLYRLNPMTTHWGRIVLPSTVDDLKTADLAVADLNEIKLLRILKDGDVTLVNTIPFDAGRYIRALTFNAVNNILFVSTIEHNGLPSVIYQVDLRSYNKTLIYTEKSEIQDMAYDCVTDTLFWIVQDNCISELRLGDAGSTPRQKCSGHTKSAITCDSRNRYLYWTTTLGTIERSLISDPFTEEMIIKGLHDPTCLVIDQQSQMLYWSDKEEGVHYSIYRSLLNGSRSENLLREDNADPFGITIARNGHIYWSAYAGERLYAIKKDSNGGHNKMKLHILPLSYGRTMGLIGRDSSMCGNAVHNDLSENSKIGLESHPNDSGYDSTTKSEPELELNPAPTDITDSSLIDLESQPTTESENESTMKFSDKDRLDNGTVVMVSNSRLNFRGCHSEYSRLNCEQNDSGRKCNHTLEELQARQQLNNGSNFSSTLCLCATKRENAMKDTDSILLTSLIRKELMECDNTRYYLLIATIVFCITSAILLVICCYLGKRVHTLSRRPRIRKRIIRHNNVPPLNGQPVGDECQITIENCCNMNICETVPTDTEPISSAPYIGHSAPPDPEQVF